MGNNFECRVKISNVLLARKWRKHHEISRLLEKIWRQCRCRGASLHDVGLVGYGSTKKVSIAAQRFCNHQTANCIYSPLAYGKPSQWWLLGYKRGRRSPRRPMAPRSIYAFLMVFVPANIKEDSDIRRCKGGGLRCIYVANWGGGSLT